MKKLFAENLRAAATWNGSPVVAVTVGFCGVILLDRQGAVGGLIVGPLALLALALLIGGFF